MSKLESARPPWLGRLFSRLIVGDGAGELRGDLDESYQRRLQERGSSFGVRVAYVIDVLLSVAHWWWSALRAAAAAIAEDVRYGARILVKQPSFTIVATVSLAVGIGATTTVFDLVNAVLLRPLPVKDAASLVTINKPEPDGDRIHAISYPDYLDYRARTDIFSDLVAWTERTISVDLDGQPEQTYAILVSGNYFSVLGAQPALGRLFTAEEDRVPGEHPVTVISFAFWQRRFGGDSSVIGRHVDLNGQPFTVIGVAAKGFTSTYAVFAPAFYAPLMMQPQLTSRREILRERTSRGLKLTGRLAPGVTREEAQAAMSLLDRQLERAYDQDRSPQRANLGVELATVGSYPWDVRLGLFGGAGLLMAIVGSVLLIACANVAGMLLARATVRRREIAVRLALGATRGRLIRQLLTESCLLFLLASTLGVGLTAWLTRVLTAIPVPVAIPFALEAKMDWRVLSFTLVLTLLTGIVFGLAPALESARVDVHTAMKDAPAMGGFKRSRMRHAFVVIQIALSVVLLIGAGLFGRALQYAQTVYPGQQPESVLTATLDPQSLGYTVPRARELYRQLIERVAALPGVEAMSMTRELQLGTGYANTSLMVQDAPQLGTLKIESNTIAPHYFQTLGIRQLSGRDFTLEDRDGTPRVVIINDAMARRFWPGASPLGRQLQIGQGTRATIVGVVEDGRHRVSGQASPPFVYWPFLQNGSNNSSMTLLLRYRGDKTEILTALRREARTLDPALPVQSAVTLSSAVETTTLPWRIAGAIASVFGIIGLALAALGIYGLVAYTVNQRTREIGVRVALGADPGDIRRLVVGHGLKLALVGLAIGLALSFGVTRALTAFLFGVSASDPATYLTESALLAAVALAASYLPARKATMTDPLVALRHE